MIRLIVKEAYTCPDGSLTSTKFRTVEIKSDELEELLTKDRSYVDVSVIGAEVVLKNRADVRTGGSNGR